MAPPGQWSAMQLAALAGKSREFPASSYGKGDAMPKAVMVAGRIGDQF